VQNGVKNAVEKLERWKSKKRESLKHEVEIQDSGWGKISLYTSHPATSTIFHALRPLWENLLPAIL
jgi:hypothetical protein